MKKILLPLLFASAPHISNGALIAEETFSYAAGALTGKGGATGGFSGAWGGGSNSGTVLAAGLAYTGLQTSGGSVNLNGNSITNFRGFSATAAGTGSGSNVWLSFLIASPANNSGLSFFNAGTEQTFSGRVSGFGGNGNVGTLFYNGASGRPLNNTAGANTNVNFSASPAINTASTHFFVLNIDQTGATPVYRGWVDPSASSFATGSTPTGGSTYTVNTNTQFFNYTQIRLGVFTGTVAEATFDEIRLGDTWADVSPVPEPSSLLLLSVGALGLLRRRR